MSDQPTGGDFIGDPADALADAGTRGCCGSAARPPAALYRASRHTGLPLKAAPTGGQA